MAPFSSSQSTRLPQASQRYHVPSHGSSSRAALNGTSHSLTTTSSRVGQRQAQAPRRDPVLLKPLPDNEALTAIKPLAYPSGLTEHQPTSSSSLGKLTRPLDRNTAASGAASHNTISDARSGRLWTAEEDRLLIASVKKHGRSWTTIKADFDDAAGGPSSRTPASIAGRYELLETMAARLPTTSNHSSASTSSTHTHDPSAALYAASSMLHKIKRQGHAGWSSKEVDKLLSIPASTRGTAVFELFCNAFPKTLRTEPAVKAKWQRVHRGMGSRRGTDGTAGDEGGEGEDDEGSYAGEDESMTPEISGPSGAASSRTSTSQPAGGVLHPQPGAFAKLAAHNVPARGNARPVANCCPSSGQAASNAASQHTEPWRSNLIRSPQDAESQTQSSFEGTSPSQQHTSQPPTLDCTIDRTSTGFTIYNAPPNHRIYIPTPIECHIIGPLPPSIMLDDNWAPFEEAAAAPFIFQVDGSGAIGAVNAPMGTRTGMGVVRSERGEVVGTQTVFTASGDGYTVAFERSVG